MQNAPVVQQIAPPPSLFLQKESFEHAWRVAKVLATSSMVPDHFQGEKNIGNVMIALNYAARIGADPFMAMQGMYIVHGRPGIEGKFMIALINTCGRFEPLRFSESGNLSKPVNEDDGCLAWTKEKATGMKCFGPKVTWDIVKAEGWLGKSGSKWKTMSQIMFRYRAASWFANLYCPEVKMGMSTREELQDVIDVQLDTTGTWSAPAPDEGEMAAEMSTSPAPSVFDKLVSENFADQAAEMDEFLDVCAKANGCTVEEAKSDAAADFGIFSKAFRQWIERRKKKDTRAPGNTVGSTADNRPPEGHGNEEKPPGGWDEWVKKWINIHGKNFPAFMASQRKWFECCPKWIDEKAREKWANLCEGPYPLDQPQEEKQLEMTFEELTQTDEWVNLLSLQQQHPDIYKQVVTKQPRTMEDVNAAIDAIASAAAAGSESDGMPND